MSLEPPRYGIPKLLRVHFANVGHADSRLDPLTLPFCQNASMGPEPVHSTIWAENGVGKTSIRSLLFSVLQPDVQRVMKSANAGGGKREYRGFFFKGHDHAMIVMEWVFDDIHRRLPGMENSHPPRRIIGMCASWSPRAADMPLDKRPLADLGRNYFSFTPNQGIYWDILPVKGLAGGGGEYCRTSKEFLDWLRTHRQSIDLKTYTTQSDWRGHLEELGLDPKLFDNQLSMNGSGGAIQVFKDRIRTPRDFVRFYLENTLPEEVGHDLVELILQDRKIILEKGKHEAGLEYLRAIEPPLDVFAATVADYRAARSALEQASVDTGHTLGLLDALAVHLAVDIQRVEAEQKKVSTQRQQHEWERERLKVYQQVLEHHVTRKALEEREMLLKEAKQRMGVAEQQAALIEAHGKWLDVKEAEDRLAPIEEQCQKLEAEEQEVLADVRKAGVTYLARLQGIITNLAQHRSRTENDLVGAQDLVDDLTKDYEELVRQQARLESEIGHLRQKHDAANGARAELVEAGVLEKGEDPRQAQKRHASARVEADGRVAEQSGVVEELNAKLLGLKAQIQPLDVERGQAVKALQAAEAEEAASRAEKERLRVLSSLCWTIDANDLAIADEGLLEAIAAAIQNRSIQRDSLAFKLDDLKRRLAPLADVDNGLLTPPGDTDKARKALLARECNVFSAGSWLDRNCTPERAKQAIAADPGRYTGLMVHAQADLERIRALSNSVTGLDHPVMVSVAGIEDNPVPGPNRHVLLPEHPATFNREEAQKLAKRLRQEVVDQETLLDTVNRSLEVAKRDVVVLGQFLKRFPKGDLGILSDAIVEAKAAVTEAERRIVANQEAIAAAMQDLKEGRKEQERRRDGAEACRKRERQIDDWLLRFQDTLDSHRLPEVEQELANRIERMKGLQQELEPLKQEMEAYRNRLAELGVQIRSHEDAMNGIPEDHRKGAAQDWSLARAKTAYSDANRRLEQSQTGESQSLFARRDERRRAVIKARNELQHFCQAKKVNPNDSGEVKLQTDIDEAITQASQNLEKAKRQYNIADYDVNLARDALNRHSMPITYQMHPDDEVPRGSQHGHELVARVKEKTSAEEQAIRVTEEVLYELGRNHLLLQSHQKEVANLQRDWSIESDITRIPWPGQDLPEPEESLEVARATLEGYRRTKDRFAMAKESRDKAYGAADRESRDRKWEAVDADKRRAVQQGADSLAEIVEAVRREYRTWREVIVDSLKRAEEAVGQIADRLTTLVKSDGLALINHAQTGSRLPDNIGEWSNRPFLKMELSGADTRNLTAADVGPYCNKVVRELLSEEVPFDGRELIIRVIDELASIGGYRVTILKPSHTLAIDRHDITRLASWSDGEIITVAILLYCCLVQARTWHRTGASRSTRPRSNGILLLDNPFGEANSPDFVQLQVEMAQKLGVQLIYTASGDPRELLAMFRRNNRLYQRRGKGVKHVGVEDATTNETIVGRGTLGLKHG